MRRVRKGVDGNRVAVRGNLHPLSMECPKTNVSWLNLARIIVAEVEMMRFSCNAPLRDAHNSARELTLDKDMLLVVEIVWVDCNAVRKSDSIARRPSDAKSTSLLAQLPAEWLARTLHPERETLRLAVAPCGPQISSRTRLPMDRYNGSVRARIVLMEALLRAARCVVEDQAAGRNPAAVHRHD